MPTVLPYSLAPSALPPADERTKIRSVCFSIRARPVERRLSLNLHAKTLQREARCAQRKARCAEREAHCTCARIFRPGAAAGFSSKSTSGHRDGTMVLWWFFSRFLDTTLALLLLQLMSLFLPRSARTAGCVATSP